MTKYFVCLVNQFVEKLLQ